jgi:heme exporter protein D
MNWSKFFWMGGYGLYVWGSYGVTFVLLGVEVLMLLKRKRNLARRESPEQFSARNL